MQKIIRFLLVVVTLLIIPLVGADKAYAQVCGGACIVCECGDNNGVPIYCDGCNQGADSCPPGTYQAPDNTCHDVGDGGCECGVNASGACIPCGGGGCSIDHVVNCPGGASQTTQITNTQCISNRAACSNTDGSMQVGSAQSVGGCCSEKCTPNPPFEDECVCNGLTVYTYTCCGAGTSASCGYVPTTYYKESCFGNNRCNVGDTWISSTTTGTRCGWETTDDGGRGDPVYFENNLCQSQVWQCSCVASCSAPTMPTLASPANGAQLSSTTVSLVWNAATFDPDCASSYKLFIGTANPPTSSITYANTVTSTNFNGSRGNTYYWYMQAVAGSNTVSSSVRSFTILNDQVTGQVFYDPTNTCGGSGWSSGGVTVSLDSAPGTAVSGTGTYAMTASVGASHTLAVNIPAGYACSTGVGCNSCSRSGVGSPSGNNNFYLTDSRESWWQAEGAGIYAGGTGGVRSILPSSSMRLILAPVSGTEGLLMTSTGSVDTGSGSVSDAGWRAISRYRGKRMDYNYFAANMGVVRGQDSDWQSDTLNLQADDGRDFWYMDPVGSTATIGVGSPWNVSGGDKYVIFVNGNLDINSDIVVAPGSFLALIVKGDVTVDPSVANLQGLYVIDGSFVTESAYVEGVVDDIQLTTGGTIVAWGTLSLSRSLGTGNITVPAEKFVYRSDLLTNMSDKMKTFVMQWSEVVPGTFNQ